ncbi:RNA-binding domain-containing protein [Natronomonas sp. EA1]|uniref:RNA-binding domain-containing protein n=1 Tax=Natronomonas sp. EA1 TaxID=3421655 RepID=UPI003EBB13BD
MIYRANIEVTAPVKDTEVTDRVRDAIENLFPEIELTHQHGELRGTTHSMAGFSEKLHEQAILDTARGAFFGGQEGNRFSFDLKKQAAFKGIVNFAVGEPSELGEIHVNITVESPDPESFVDSVAPPTEDGRPVEPED